MITTVEAIYENGVLKLSNPLPLPEKTPVLVSVRSVAEKENAHIDTEAFGMVLRDHSAFLNSYAPSDEGLYNDAESR